MLIEILTDKWAGIRGGLLTTIDKFSDADLTFRPFEGAYSVAELMLHVAHEESIEIHWGLARKLDEMPPAHDASTFPSVTSIKEVLTSVHADSLGYLSTLNDEGLRAEVELAWGQKARPTDMLWHVVEHEIHHRGELSLILGLLGRQGLDA